MKQVHFQIGCQLDFAHSSNIMGINFIQDVATKLFSNLETYVLSPLWRRGVGPDMGPFWVRIIDCISAFKDFSLVSL
jgi:hypothetical protein